jgi:hypothetical protein
MKYLTGLTFILLCAGCGVLIGNPSTDDDSNELVQVRSPTSPGSGSDVNMQGNFVVDEGANLRLLSEEEYNLYCPTHEADRKSCKVTVVSDGSFTAKCENFAAISFSCFVRLGNEILTPVIFDDQTGLLTGGGSLVFDVNYHTKTGVARATVDVAKSNALNQVFIDSLSGQTTVAADFTGTWNLNCISDADINSDCSDNGWDSGVRQRNFFEFGEESQRLVSIWYDLERRNRCVADGGDEGHPNFHAAVGGISSPLDITTEASYVRDIDIIFDNFSNTLKNEILGIAESRTSSDITGCKTGQADFLNPSLCQNDPGSTFADITRLQANEARNVATRIFGFSGSVAYSCEQHAIPLNFTFNDCKSDSKPRFCDDSDYVPGNLGLTINASGLLELDPSYVPTYFYGPSVSGPICPAISDEFFAKELAGDKPDVVSYANNCRQYFVSENTTAYAQAQVVKQVSDVWRDEVEQILCDRPSSDPLHLEIETFTNQGCLPSARYEVRCSSTEAGNCDSKLTCPGSRNGECFDSYGNYAGGITGREAVMNYIPGIKGAFELNAFNSYSWDKWEGDVIEQCYYVTRLLINGTKVSDNEFDSIFSTGSSTFCGAGNADFSGADIHSVTFDR